MVASNLPLGSSLACLFILMIGFVSLFAKNSDMNIVSIIIMIATNRNCRWNIAMVEPTGSM